MTREDILKKLKELNLPKNSYVAYGSSPLAVAGIREAKDIDILASKEVYKHLQDQGWEQLNKGPLDKPLARYVFEVHQTWAFSPYSPTLEQLQASAVIVDGIPFASLLEVRKWKEASGGEKNLADIRLIGLYLQEKELREIDFK